MGVKRDTEIMEGPINYSDFFRKGCLTRWERVVMVLFRKRRYVSDGGYCARYKVMRGHKILLREWM